MDDRNFGERYYLHDCGLPYRRDGHWTSFFGRIADAVAIGIGPRRVLDAGCAMGLFVEALRDRGIEAYGFDISSYALANAPVDVRPFCWSASVTDEIAGAYDLIVCQEVLAHLTRDDAERAVANFCRHTDDVLFSNLPYGPAPLHLNLEPPEHWAGVFAQHGFYRDFGFDASVITPFAVRYRRSSRPVETLVCQYEQRLHWLRAERDQSCREHALSRELLASERTEAERARLAESRAAAHVRLVESSWFWKARTIWNRMSGR